MNELPKRKPLRLSGYDYSQNGAYFVTICTEGRRPLLGSGILVGRDPCVPPTHPAHRIAWEWLWKLEEKFPPCRVELAALMPNHVHLLLRLSGHTLEDMPQGRAGTRAAGHMGPALPNGESERSDPTLSEVIQWYKTMTTNAYIRAVRSGALPAFQRRLWQTGFYDEIIRTEGHYLRIWQYIHDNPVRWTEDIYYEE